MRKPFAIRLVLSSLLIICTIWVAMPKVYVHGLMGHHHTTVPNPLETSVQQDVKDDCEFDKYDSPVYFTIFKIINNLLPSKPKEQSYLRQVPVRYNTATTTASLRAPPQA